MGLMILEQAVSALKNAGFKTRRVYYGTAMPAINQVVAAVQVAEVDFAEKKLSLEAMLLCPQKLGGAACEDAALTAAQALEDIGFSCRIGAVTFDGRSGLFCISCIATVQEPEPEPEEVSVYIPFKIGGIAQKWVVSFTAQRKTDEIILELEDAPWQLRLEQFFPIGETEDRDPEGEQFSLTYGSEKYTGCVWTTQKRVTEADGIRQTREGTAAGRTIN